LLRANLGVFKDCCEIIEFNLRQPLAEKTTLLLAANPDILGISISIWNHTATLELLAELEKMWASRPVIVLGGPEVSHLPPEAEIFRYADYVIRGEGEIAFRELCETIFHTEQRGKNAETKFINAKQVPLNEIYSAYDLYTDEDIAKKLIYVEAGRDCPFNCEFCLSAVKNDGEEVLREFPIDKFLADMDALIQRGVKTFKFLDRTFNVNPQRALRIINFFLEKLQDCKTPFIVHFEMVPSLFPPDLCDALIRFPPGTLRLEIGIQTLNEQVSTRIGRRSNPEKELETLRFLRKNTNAIIHADLIAGLPGEDLASFASGFDRLWSALFDQNRGAEIQLGILKLLPGAPIARHKGMRYNPMPPYEILETDAMTAKDIARITNFAHYWEIIVNRGLFSFPGNEPIFARFMKLSDSLLKHFGRNWGIDKYELIKRIKVFISKISS
jgi:radical SAM superfamily enzyme YgiQ (UPF0313 family)